MGLQKSAREEHLQGRYSHSLFIQFTSNLSGHSLERPNRVVNHIELLILGPHDVVLLLQCVIQELPMRTVQFILQLGVLGCPVACGNSNRTVLQKWLWERDTLGENARNSRSNAHEI
jgi:hypothetical protein